MKFQCTYLAKRNGTWINPITATGTLSQIKAMIRKMNAEAGGSLKMERGTFPQSHLYWTLGGMPVIRLIVRQVA